MNTEKSNEKTGQSVQPDRSGLKSNGRRNPLRTFHTGLRKKKLWALGLLVLLIAAPASAAYAYYVFATVSGSTTTNEALQLANNGNGVGVHAYYNFAGNANPWLSTSTGSLTPCTYPQSQVVSSSSSNNVPLRYLRDTGIRTIPSTKRHSA